MLLSSFDGKNHGFSQLSEMQTVYERCSCGYWIVTKGVGKQKYRKHPQISRTFFPKIVAQNRGCGLSAGTFQKGAVHFSELTLL